MSQVCIVSGVDETTWWLTELLSSQGHAVLSVADVHALAATLPSPPDVLVIDARADRSQALDILAMVESRSALECVPILLLDEEPAAPLIKLIAVASGDYLVGPLHSEAIVARVELALRRGSYLRATQQASSSNTFQISSREGAKARRVRSRTRKPLRLCAFASKQSPSLQGIASSSSPQPSETPDHAGAHRQASVSASVFERAIEYLPIGVMIVSPMNQIEYVNQALCDFVGYSMEELLGRQPGFMVLPEDHAATVARGHLLAAGQIDQFVHERRRYVRKDGALALGKLTVYAPRDDAGRPVAFLGFIEDIGNRVWVEDQLARYTRYQQALANASLTLLTAAPDAATRSTALRKALEQLLDGATVGRAYMFRNVSDPQHGLALDLVAEAWSAGHRSLRQASDADRFAPLPYAILPQAHRERMLAGLPAGGLVQDIYAETPDMLAIVSGEGICSTQTVPVHLDGRLWGMLGFDDYAEPRVWDHTDLMLLTSAASMLGQTLHRWQIEDDLRATSQFLATTGEVAHVGGWTVDLETRVPILSSELARLLELDANASLDLEQLLTFYPPEVQPEIRTVVRAAIQDGDGWELELPMVTTSGRRIWVNSRGQAERREGRTVRLYGAVQDVTRRKEAELRLANQLSIEAAMVKCSQELLAPVRSEADLAQVAAPALEHLRAALNIDQAYLMRLVADPTDPYLTLVALATIPIAESFAEHPLAQRFSLSFIPQARLNTLLRGDVLLGIPDQSELAPSAQQSWRALDQAHARITFPVRIDGALWGVLGFNGLTERAWDEQEQTVLRTTAEMFSHVIRRWIAESELRRSEEQFRTAVETMLDGFAILDTVRDEAGKIVDFRYRYINEVGCLLNQRTREAHLGHTLLDLLSPYRDSNLFADYVRLVETGMPVAREHLVYEDQADQGERLARLYDVRAARLGDGFAMIWRDITDRRLAHESLARANTDLLRRVSELRTLNTVAQTLVFTQDLPTGLETVCAAVAAQTGAQSVVIVGFAQRRRSEGTEATVAPDLDQLAGVSVLAPEDFGILGDALLAQRRPIALVRKETNFILSETTLHRLQCADAAYLLLVPLTAPTGNLGLLALGRGSSGHAFSAENQSFAETVAGQIATAISNAQLAEHARRAATLAERNRVAHDLHDSATQSLYSLVLIAAGWAMQASNGRLTDTPAKFTQLSEIAVQVLKELRLLIYQLRHPELEAVGLIKALEERLAAVEQRANIATTFEVTGELMGLPLDHEEQLYMMLQEVLNNALRHARASKVSLAVHSADDVIIFTVRDDGIGFDPESTSGGLGLRSLQERAAKIGARLSLSAQPGQGTLIEIRVPATTTTGGISRA
ncbi:PAS domain S-box protein [Candidatus Chloroploca asiatica]|uniref:PAS domain S-box protein n=1 Tax=Candidatus Chloroploca asiatica TaxID=1506545 RepID=UPI00114493A3|nr:PAS domain S-box protein [Candidatus Chloroploca asiatica]